MPLSGRPCGSQMATDRQGGVEFVRQQAALYGPDRVRSESDTLLGQGHLARPGS